VDPTSHGRWSCDETVWSRREPGRFGEWPPPDDLFGYELVRGSVIAAIVGRSDWRPATLAPLMAGGQVERWLWTGEDLGDDGHL